MDYDLNNKYHVTQARSVLEHNIKLCKILKIEVLKEKRTNNQNRAIHKFFHIISDQLNEMGIEFNYTGLKGKELSIMHTPNIVKEFIWKPIQLALFGIESTTELTTNQINDISDVLIKYFAEKGVVLIFPSKDNN